MFANNKIGSNRLLMGYSKLDSVNKVRLYFNTFKLISYQNNSGSCVQIKGFVFYSNVNKVDEINREVIFVFPAISFRKMLSKSLSPEQISKAYKNSYSYDIEFKRESQRQYTLLSCNKVE